MKGILDPAVKGTTGILKAIKAYAPEVKRVVVTSSFAAIVQPDGHPKVYDESSWNSVTWDEAAADRSKTYRGSKVRDQISPSTHTKLTDYFRKSPKRPRGTLSRARNLTSMSSP